MCQRKIKLLFVKNTSHHNREIDLSTWEEKKPAIITTYKDTKYGVHILDKI